MSNYEYLMESEEEVFRLEMKTNTEVVKKQAIWAGIKPGMRVADIGCGSGKTTSVLYQLVQPGGNVVGIDGSEERIKYAEDKYSAEGIEFRCRNILEPFDDLGMFDFVWVRFILEYYLKNSFDIVKNISRIVKPGGILCLIDLDCNALNHYEPPERLEKTIQSLMDVLQREKNFDPYAGRKLYSFLYDLDYQDIDADVAAHHLIFGRLKDEDAANWMKKVEIIAKKTGYKFEEYEGGYDEFLFEATGFFTDPGRFTYTPVILCRGRKPE
jgi:ubiquinone/menaquinone biosynthesis C-methylase UbiE